jgi:hypothetical protein
MRFTGKGSWRKLSLRRCDGGKQEKGQGDFEALLLTEKKRLSLLWLLSAVEV